MLWPHGLLFRTEEQAMRLKMIEQDWVEAVIGLGPKLFYNSPMESCVVICNRKKPAAHRGRVIGTTESVMRDNFYSASLSRTQGRNTWAVIFRHPKRTDPTTGKEGLRVRQSLKTCGP